MLKILTLQKCVRRSFLSIFFSTILWNCLSFAQVDPKIDWKMMRLPHFDLIYDAKHQELANLYADRLEDNVQFLSQYFTTFPERTVVVLDDRTDLTNGYATPVPYQTIVLYPVLPGPQETISEYGDWARELTMHEFTHTLSFQPRRGVVKGLYYTFGNIVTPNLLLPRWLLEGVAVDLETRTSAKGRLRSSFQDGMIRAYVLNQKLDAVQLAEINETSIHTWPQGARPYLFGSLMWSQMIALHGTKLIEDLHWRYGGRMPFFVEGPARDLTGTSFPGMLESVKEDLTKRSNAHIGEIRKAPTFEGSTLTVHNGIENFYPVISPDGLKMIFLSKDDANKRSVRILRRPSVDVAFSGDQEKAEIDQRFGESLQELNPTPKASGRRDGIDENEDSPPGGTIQRLAWFPDSQRFVFDKLDTVDRYHDSSDLYYFDLGKLKVERITRDERAREASVSPDSRTLAFVKLDAGRTHLAVYDLEQKTSKILYSPPLQARISFPVFLNASEIVFTERYNGQELLKKISIGSLQVQNVLSNYPDARFPTLTPKGLIFSSTYNGVANLYLASTDLNSARPLTNTVTYVSLGAFDPHRSEIYSSELTTSGFQIRNTTLAQAQSLPATLPKVKPLLDDRYPAQKRDVPSLQKPEVEDYTIWPYILPHYWLPNFYAYDGGVVFGGSIAGADPLAKHTYGLAAAYDTEPQETSMNFLYANNTTPATVLVKAFDYHTAIVNTDIRFRQQNYEADAIWEIPAVSTDFYAGFGYRWIGRDYSVHQQVVGDYRTSETESHGPSLLMAYSDFTMSGAQVTPERGMAMTFSATEYLQGGKITEDFRQYQLSVQKYFSKWLPRHHAIMVRAQGQYTDRDVSLANGAFSIAYSPFANMLTPFYIMRGYLNGQFLGRSLANYTFEYRFPIYNVYRGAGTTPLFIKRFHGAVVADGLSVDGYSYNSERELYERVNSWRSFWSTGIELKADLTLGYHFPITAFAGYYFPHESRYREGQQFVIGAQF